MLETVLRIGKAFRESPTGLKHHRYVKPCPQDTDKRKILRLSLPVNKDFSFDFDGIKETTDENIIRDKLFYPTFKTSDADGLVKYIFGDIYYSLSKGKEGGYYRLGNNANKQKAYQVSSFFRGCEDFRSLETMYEAQSSKQGEKGSFSVALFRQEFEKNIAFTEKIFKYQCGISEFLESKRNEEVTFIELLSNDTVLQQLTAKRNFSAIKGPRKNNFTI